MSSEAYKRAGVDTEAAENIIDDIKHSAIDNYNINVVSGIGGFASCYRIPIEDYDEPILVSSTDGVGTKLKIATRYGKHYGIGLDVVAMCINDLITTGATPLNFLDYYATGKLDHKVTMEVMQGIISGCKKAEC